MEQTYSLMAILRQDPDFAGALEKKKEAVKKDKQNLVSAAKTYTQKYEKEIAEGTKLRQKLLTEGAAAGKTEDEVLSNYGQFLPSVIRPSSTGYSSHSETKPKKKHKKCSWKN